MWHVYILECSDDSFYVGRADNLQSRLLRHNEGRGAKHTVRRRPVKLVWQEAHETKESAVKCEKQIKGWTKAKKKALVEGNIEVLCTLAKCKTASGRAFAKKQL
ncbi:MAG: GIY-YIG nuclease family protein [Phycisphaerae bacterium]|nr:GIY-YIG nuclease family protein [Phycisphaerae bacterium]